MEGGEGRGGKGRGGEGRGGEGLENNAQGDIHRPGLYSRRS